MRTLIDAHPVLRDAGVWKDARTQQLSHFRAHSVRVIILKDPSCLIDRA